MILWRGHPCELEAHPRDFAKNLAAHRRYWSLSLAAVLRRVPAEPLQAWELQVLGQCCLGVSHLGRGRQHCRALARLVQVPAHQQHARLAMAQMVCLAAAEYLLSLGAEGGCFLQQAESSGQVQLRVLQVESSLQKELEMGTL